jgi:hypothetical protein
MTWITVKKPYFMIELSWTPKHTSCYNWIKGSGRNWFASIINSIDINLLCYTMSLWFICNNSSSPNILLTCLWFHYDALWVKVKSNIAIINCTSIELILIAFSQDFTKFKMLNIVSALNIQIKLVGIYNVCSISASDNNLNCIF